MVAREPETDDSRISRLEGAYQHLATKEDVANTRSEIANVRTEIANVRTEIADIKAYVAAAETRLIRWGIGGMSVGFAAMTAIIKLA